MLLLLVGRGHETENIICLEMIMYLQYGINAEGTVDICFKQMYGDSGYLFGGIIEKTNNKEERVVKRALSIAVAAIFALSACLALAADKGTANEAKAMVAAGVAHIKTVGKDKAFADFNAKTGKFGNKDLYLFVVDFEGLTLAHGGSKAMIGKNMISLRDPDGKYFIKEMVNVAQTKGSGWVDYKWSNPATKKIEAKSTYVQRSGEFFLGCGIYK
jgi:cytochrome c